MMAWPMMGELGWGSRWQDPGVPEYPRPACQMAGPPGLWAGLWETCSLPWCYNWVVKHFRGQLAPGQGIAPSRWFSDPINGPRWEAVGRPQEQ